MQSIRVLASLIAFAAAPSVVRAQNVLETPRTRVEVLGLKRWTVPMIQDSLARYAPHDSLTSHACAAILRMKLKFPDAAASYFEPDSAGRELIVVAVVEPQDSALVRYRSPAPDSSPDIARYSAAIASFRGYNGDFQGLIQDSAFMVGHSAQRHTDARWTRLEPVRRLLSSEHTAAGQRRAIRVLARDRNPYNRVMALVVLSGFPKNNDTWLTLADELRYPDGMVSATASQLITTLARYAPRTIDWSPAVDGISAVMAGTNLFAQLPLIEVLTRTRISPSLSRPLMRAGAPLLLARLGASPEAGRDRARGLLEQLSGQNYGNDLAAWTRWAAAVQGGT
jgi:hypothetical protein